MRVFVLFLFCLNFWVTLGQNNKNIDTSYIERLRNKVLLKLSYDSKSNIYTLYDIKAQTKANIASKDQRKLFLSFDHDFLGFSIGLSPEFLSGKNSNLKGESTFFNLNMRLFIGRVIQGFSYKNTKGFYIENTEDFIPDWVEGEDEYQQYPDLRNWGISGYTSFVFNRNFSVRSLSHQTEWQKRSAGSLVPTVSYSFDKFSNTESGFESTEDVIDINFELAYHYTWVLSQNWFISPYILGAMGPRFSKFNHYTNGQQVEDNNQFISNTFESGLQLGYASRKMVYGLSLNYAINKDNDDALFNITQDKSYLLLYFGYRFNAPNFIKKPFEWVHKVIGF